VVAALGTHTGQVRDHNEDFFGFWEPQTAAEQESHGWLYIVADGVGGAEAGEVASSHATEEVMAHYIASDGEDVADRLLEAARHANDSVRHLALESGRIGYMATTMVAVVIRHDTATFLNVGDSRGYQLRDGVLHQITKDQSLVAQLVEQGAITAEEALTHPRRNVILYSLGPAREPRIDLFEVDVRAGDQILLCSDGLTRHLEDGEIAAVLLAQEPEAAARNLLQIANQRGGSDNITAAVIRIGGEAFPLSATAGETKEWNGEGAWVVSRESADTRRPRHNPGLWFYTLLLTLVEALLIIAAWYWLRV
jgi:protein phosphatase